MSPAKVGTTKKADQKAKALTAAKAVKSGQAFKVSGLSNSPPPAVHVVPYGGATSIEGHTSWWSCFSQPGLEDQETKLITTLQ
ncbi:hypothetical protein Bca4012_020806 [Brassica carinata]